MKTVITIVSSILLFSLLTFGVYNLIGYGNTENTININDEISDVEKPMFMTTMTHMESNYKDDQIEAIFKKRVKELRYGMDLAEEYGAILTIESEKPFARANTKWDDNLMAEALERGHGVGTHCDIGGREKLDYDEFVNQLKENKQLVDDLVGAENNMGCSGAGGPNNWVQAALDAGFTYIDGLVGFHLLAFDEENRVEPWDDQKIYNETYHFSVPQDPLSRINFMQLKDLDAWEDDGEGIVISNGEFGRIDYMSEGGIGVCGTGMDPGKGDCAFEKNDVDLWVEKIMELDAKRDRSKYAKLSLYFPTPIFIEKNEEVLRYFFSEMQRLENEGVIQWSSQRDAVLAYLNDKENNKQESSTIDSSTTENAVLPEDSEDSLEPVNADKESSLYTLFSLNVHDWVNPEESAKTINRVIDLHEKYDIPIGIYLTDPSFQNYVEMNDTLVDRLATSDVVEIGYHFRPPYPAYNGFDINDLASLNEEDRYEKFLEYETRALDLETGLPSNKPGGFKFITDTLGEAPIIAAIGSSYGPIRQTLTKLYYDLGAVFTVGRNGVDLGDMEGDLYIRPEHYDLKLYEQAKKYSKLGKSIEEILEEATQGLQKADTGPQIIGIKYHENNFYLTGTPFAPCMWEDNEKSIPYTPPYDLDLCYEDGKDFLPLPAQQEQWDLYEATLAYIDANRDKYPPTSLKELLDVLE